MQINRMQRRRIRLAVCVIIQLVALSLRPAAASQPLEGVPLPPPVGDVLLVVGGAITQTNVGSEAHLDLAALRSLPTVTLKTTTVVTDGVKHFEGVLLRDLLLWVGAAGSYVEARALNNYTVDIPIKDFHDYDVILATHMDGNRLLTADKGPLWIVYPRDQWRALQDIRYDYRWVWQLNRLTIK